MHSIFFPLSNAFRFLLHTQLEDVGVQEYKYTYKSGLVLHHISKVKHLGINPGADNEEKEQRAKRPHLEALSLTKFDES